MRHDDIRAFGVRWLWLLTQFSNGPIRMQMRETLESSVVHATVRRLKEEHRVTISACLGI